MVRIARGCLRCASGVVIFSTLVGFLGSMWWVFDLLANFRPQLLAAGAIAAIATTVIARREQGTRALAVAVTLIGCVLLNAITLVPLWTGRVDAPTASQRLTIGHLNLQGRRGDPTGFGDFLKQRAVDVFVVLDADPSWVAAAQGSADGYRVLAGPAGTRSWVFANAPIAELSHPDLEHMPTAALQLRVTLGATVVRVLAVHMPSPITPTAARQRGEAFAAMAQWDRGQPPGPHIVTGDFNATRWSASFRQLLTDTSLEDSARGFGYQPSYPARFWPAAIPIDQSVHTSDLITTDRTVGPPFGSGHNSLVVTYAAS